MNFMQKRGLLLVVFLILIAVPGYAFCLGDFNNDNKIDEEDMGLLQGEFNKAVDSGNQGYDMDGSGMVDFGDFVLLAKETGKACPLAKPITQAPLLYVKGIVFDSATNKPLRAEITYTSEEWLSPLVPYSTDANGEFEFLAPQGVFNVVVTSYGYEDSNYYNLIAFEDIYLNIGMLKTQVQGPEETKTTISLAYAAYEKQEDFNFIQVKAADIFEGYELEVIENSIKFIDSSGVLFYVIEPRAGWVEPRITLKSGVKFYTAYKGGLKLLTGLAFDKTRDTGNGFSFYLLKNEQGTIPLELCPGVKTTQAAEGQTAGGLDGFLFRGKNVNSDVSSWACISSDDAITGVENTLSADDLGRLRLEGGGWCSSGLKKDDFCKGNQVWGYNCGDNCEREVFKTDCGVLGLVCKSYDGVGRCVDKYSINLELLSKDERDAWLDYREITRTLKSSDGLIEIIANMPDGDEFKVGFYKKLYDLRMRIKGIVSESPNEFNLELLYLTGKLESALYRAELVVMQRAYEDPELVGIERPSEEEISEKKKVYAEVINDYSLVFEKVIERSDDPLIVADARMLLAGLWKDANLPGSLSRFLGIYRDIKNAFADENKERFISEYKKRGIAVSEEHYAQLQNIYREYSEKYILKGFMLLLVGQQVQNINQEGEVKKSTLTSNEDIFEPLDIGEIRAKTGENTERFSEYLFLETANRIFHAGSLYGEGKKLYYAGKRLDTDSCDEEGNEEDIAKGVIGNALLLKTFGVDAFSKEGDYSRAKVDASSVMAYTIRDALDVVEGVSLFDAARIIGIEDDNRDKRLAGLPNQGAFIKIKENAGEIQEFKKLKLKSTKGIPWYYVKYKNGDEKIFVGCGVQEITFGGMFTKRPALVGKSEAISFFRKLPLIEYAVRLESEMDAGAYELIQASLDASKLGLARGLRNRAGESSQVNVVAYQQAITLYGELIADGYRYKPGEERVLFNGEEYIYENVWKELEDMTGGVWYDLNLGDSITLSAAVEGSLEQMTNVWMYAAGYAVNTGLKPLIAAKNPVIRGAVGKVIPSGVKSFVRTASAGVAGRFSGSFESFSMRVAQSIGKEKVGYIAYFGRGAGKGFKFVAEEGIEELVGTGAQEIARAASGNAPFISDVVGMLSEIVAGGIDIDA